MAYEPILTSTALGVMAIALTFVGVRIDPVGGRIGSDDPSRLPQSAVAEAVRSVPPDSTAGLSASRSSAITHAVSPHLPVRRRLESAT